MTRILDRQHSARVDRQLRTVRPGEGLNRFQPYRFCHLVIVGHEQCANALSQIAGQPQLIGSEGRLGAEQSSSREPPFREIDVAEGVYVRIRIACVHECLDQQQRRRRRLGLVRVGIPRGEGH